MTSVLLGVSCFKTLNEHFMVDVLNAVDLLSKQDICTAPHNNCDTNLQSARVWHKLTRNHTSSFTYRPQEGVMLCGWEGNRRPGGK